MNAASAGQPDEREDPLCEELLGYLREHPRAMDTLEGIAEWWLPRYRIRVEVERIRRAIETLTRKGLLVRVEEKERVHYRLRRDMAGMGDEGADPARPDHGPRGDAANG